MAIAAGERLPEGRVLRMGEGGVEEVATRELFAGRRVVLFGVPGAYTSTCTNAHVPSFVRTRPRLAEKGVDAVLCLAGNDPFVLRAWGEATGATAAGIEMIADPSGDWIVALGEELTNPAVGFHRRSRRFAALIEDGVVRHWADEESPGACTVSSGEAMLERL